MIEKLSNRILTDTPFVLKTVTLVTVFVLSAGFFLNQLHQMNSASFADAQTVEAVFATQSISIAPGGVAEVNVLMKIPAGYSISAASAGLTYSAGLLDYVSQPQPNADCAAANFKLSAVYKEKNDTASGLLSVTHGLLAADSGLPSGLTCWGTFRFKAKAGVSVPATATIGFSTDMRYWEVVGPLTGYAPVFDASKTVTVRIVSATPSPTSAIPTTIADTMPPTVSIQSPANGSTVARNSTLKIEAAAQDDRQVSKIDLFVNNDMICSQSGSVASCDWRITGKPNASYSIEARAYDSSGNIKSVTSGVVSSQ